ncbi:DUF6809 family protein [Paenibacillus sp. Mc5Re-14]|nr:DUF6809 family protein [Paenibacillus sp. Mc5Re-14]
MSILEDLYYGKWYLSQRTKPKNPELELVHQKISASIESEIVGTGLRIN